jgi:hypothetical protein
MSDRLEHRPHDSNSTANEEAGAPSRRPPEAPPSGAAADSSSTSVSPANHPEAVFTAGVTAGPLGPRPHSAGAPANASVTEFPYSNTRPPLHKSTCSGDKAV